MGILSTDLGRTSSVPCIFSSKAVGAQKPASSVRHISSRPNPRRAIAARTVAERSRNKCVSNGGESTAMNGASIVKAKGR